MNPTYQINQVADSQPDADDSIVPISTLHRTLPPPFWLRAASWKLGTTTVNKQGDQRRLYINLRRETLGRANQAVLSRQGIAKTTKTSSDRVWGIASYTRLDGTVMPYDVALSMGHQTVRAQSN